MKKFRKKESNASSEGLENRKNISLLGNLLRLSEFYYHIPASSVPPRFGKCSELLDAVLDTSHVWAYSVVFLKDYKDSATNQAVFHIVRDGWALRMLHNILRWLLVLRRPPHISCTCDPHRALFQIWNSHDNMCVINKLLLKD